MRWRRWGEIKYEAAKDERCRKAVELATTMQSSCYLLSLEEFRRMGRMQCHETVRKAKTAAPVDTIGGTQQCEDATQLNHS